MKAYKDRDESPALNKVVTSVRLELPHSVDIWYLQVLTWLNTHLKQIYCFIDVFSLVLAWLADSDS